MNIAPTVSKGESKGKTVLVVDDYASVCVLLATQLSESGFHVLTAYGGEEAKEVIARQGGENIDLLITDLEMPRIRGDELAEWFQRENPDAKVLLMSVYSQSGKGGANVGFLQKPFRIDTLGTLVDKFLGIAVNGAELQPSITGK